MKTFVRICQDIGLLVARIVFGAIMVFHGWQRWNGGLPAQVQYLESVGVPQAELLAWGTVILEILGGVLMVFGILTPFVAAAFVVEFVLVIVWIKWPHGPAIGDGGYEYTLALAGFALVFVVFGAGRAAVDNLFRRPRGEDRKSASYTSVRDSDPV